jgi:hypothetical protein
MIYMLTFGNDLARAVSFPYFRFSRGSFTYYSTAEVLHKCCSTAVVYYTFMVIMQYNMIVSQASAGRAKCPADPHARRRPKTV